MVKKLIFVLFGVLFGLSLQAQRIAVVDSEYILTQMPEYKQAQQQLDQLSRTWESEVEALLKAASDLRSEYEAEKVLLTDDLKADRLAAIEEKEKEAKEKQQLYFGVEGKVYTKRQELIKPVQDKIFNAIREVAQRKNYDLILDKGSELIALYVSERVNISDEVIAKLNN